MKCIVGLGNPGNEYSKTRHNIGFMVIEKMIKKFHLKQVKKFHSLCYELNKGVFLLLPQTYMNRSGTAVQSIYNFYKIGIQNIIIIHDDIDLELGKIKVKIGGGSGGHNGLKSIDSHIGNEYLRVRLGIGKNLNIDTSDYVLQNFLQSEVAILNKMIDFVSENILNLHFSSESMSQFITHYHHFLKEK